MVVYLAVEGDSDVPVAERMIRSVGLEPYRAVVARGKSQLDPRIPDLNRSGTRLNWLILRDLDHVGSRPGGSAFSKSQPNALNAPRTGRQRDLVLIGPARLRAPCRRSPTGIYSGKRAMLVISKRRVEHTIDRMSTMCKSARHS